MIRSLALALLCLVPSNCGFAADKPNVLFIAVDDLNDWIGCLNGHPQAYTPNIDRLASRGMLFTNAHCAAPACNPSRAAISSGLMPITTNVWSNNSGSIGKAYPNARHLPTAFKNAGYYTAGTGKLLHNKKLAQTLFDEYQVFEQRWSPFDGTSVKYTSDEQPSKGTENPRHLLRDSQGRDVILPRNRMPSDRKPNQNDGESFDWGGFDLPDSDWGDTKITDWAIDRLKQDHEKPVFLGIGYYRPHIPLFAPQRFFDRFKDGKAKLPSYSNTDLNDLSSTGKKWAIEAVTAGLHSTVVEHGEWEAAVAAYLACVTYVDHEIGRLLEAFDSSKISKDTWIILWSDHGWQLGEKDHWGKWTGWERSTKVPLIVVPPTSQMKKFAKPGSMCNMPVGLIDLYPTLVELCGLEAPTVLDGDSLVPLLSNPSAKFRSSTLTMFDEGNVSVRDKQWRYIQYADGNEELYDLENDPNEWKNVAQESASSVSLTHMRNELQGHLIRYQENANRVSGAQLKWVGVYRKQANIPKPADMLLNKDSEPDLSNGFTDLYSEDLKGWTPRGGECKFEAVGKSIVGKCVKGSPSTYLCTKKSDYKDFVFTAELKHVVDGNTGFMFRAASKPGEGKSEGREIVYGPQCEVEAYSKQRFWSGGIYGQSAGGWIYPMWLKQHEQVRQAMKPKGQWNRITVQAKGTEVKTWLNGKPAACWKTDEYKSGFFGLQIHEGASGEIHFRNIKVKELARD